MDLPVNRLYAKGVDALVPEGKKQEVQTMIVSANQPTPTFQITTESDGDLPLQAVVLVL